LASYHLSIKSGKKGKASEHANYIAREGKHGKDDKKKDLIAVEHGNLPAWSDNNPSLFWKMADQNERINGAAYREFELALPAELSPKQNLELVNKFVSEEIGSKPFLFAIHAPKSALSGVDQPHAHVMFSDRKPDGIDRSPQQHFKRYNADEPELGGCRKDSGGKAPDVLKNEVKSTRARWAELQNVFLEMNGHNARVDHRSNRDRGIDQEAERHLGQAGINKMSSDEKLSYQTKRQGGQRTSA